MEKDFLQNRDMKQTKPENKSEINPDGEEDRAADKFILFFSGRQLGRHQST